MEGCRQDASPISSVSICCLSHPPLMAPSLSPSYPSFLLSFFPCLLFSFFVFLFQPFPTLLQLYFLFMFFHLIFSSPKFLQHQLGKYLFSALSLTDVGANTPQCLSLPYSTTHSSIYAVSPHPSIQPSIQYLFRTHFSASAYFFTISFLNPILAHLLAPPVAG